MMESVSPSSSSASMPLDSSMNVSCFPEILSYSGPNFGNVMEGEDDEGGREENGKLNGRWTKSEHELFLRGMSLWGRDWKKVQSAVKVELDTQV